MPDEADPTLIHGVNTKFTEQFANRSQLTLPGDGGSAEFAEIISDTALRLKKPLSSDAARAALRATDASGNMVGSKYKITPHIDQGEMFSEVTRRLFEGGAVGIFPEGGSHDRPEMLPLKAGVAIMALEAIAKHPGLPVKIIPCGLNYFHADKFRSRAVVEYGDPIEIPSELVQDYLNGGPSKREAISLLLDTVTVSLKNLTLQAPDFDTLMVIQAVRRLYTPIGRKLDVDQSLALSRQFAIGYAKLRDHPQIQELTKMVHDYNSTLKYYGVQDHQVKNTNISSTKALPLLLYRIAELIVLVSLALPSVILFSPLLILSRVVSHRKAAEALAGSSVKIAGKDVVTTWKVLTAMVVIPTLWIFYTTVAFGVTFAYSTFSLALAVAAGTFILLPVLGLATIRISDIGFDILKSLPPLIVSLTTPTHASTPLRVMRADLTAKITSLTVQFGPQVFPNFEEKRIVSQEEAQLNVRVVEKLRRNSTMRISSNDLLTDDALDDNFFFDRERSV
nr:hypothetical protein HK105_003068 [Polyrhizophydium stewartii]